MTSISIGEAILAGGGVLVVVGVIVAAWRQIKKHGAKDAELAFSKRSEDDAHEQAEALAGSPIDGRTQLDALGRLRDR